MKEVIMKVPSFSADYPKAPIYVADLIRCKECRYLEVHGKTTKYYWCDQWEHYTDEQDFCSSGEREGE